MKTHFNSEQKGPTFFWAEWKQSPWRALPLHILGLVGSICFGLCLGMETARAQSDDFDDGNDEGWERYDPIGENEFGLPGVGTWSFPGGNTYRLESSVTPNIALGPSRLGSIRTNIYSDFYLELDLVDWDPALDQAVGLLARVTERGLGTSDGYAMTYQVADGDIDITSFLNEDPDPDDPDYGEVPTTGNDVVNAVLGRTYRFVFKGVGSELTASVFELPDLSEPVAEITGTDTSWTSGECGLVAFDNSGGTGTCDVTFDNYLAAVSAPPRLQIMLGAFGDVNINWATNNSVGYILQATESIGSPVWTNLSPSFEFQGQWIYEAGDDVADMPKRFYRLFRP